MCPPLRSGFSFSISLESHFQPGDGVCAYVGDWDARVATLREQIIDLFSLGVVGEEVTRLYASFAQELRAMKGIRHDW